uniref:Uncharacterized protein n=1 Tax=Anguilla anguilla TaxID=7936 RepID=A0A0E9WJG2_ANGAN
MRDSLTVTCKPYCYIAFFYHKKSIAYIVGAPYISVVVRKFLKLGAPVLQVKKVNFEP